MFTNADYEKLEQIMNESEQHRALLQKLLTSHEETLRILRHELGNTLTMLSGSVQFIETTHPEVTSFKYWGTLQTDISDMTKLLNDLSRFHQKQILQKETLDTTRFLRSLSLSFAASIAHTKVEFASYIPDHLPEISADATKLKEVLLNLLKNALEALDDTMNVSANSDQKAAASKKITLHASASNEQLKIQVSDNGCGIPKDQLSHIFDPFITSKSGGTGLGLSISKQIVDTHHGTLTVASETGVGTTFTILLPIP